MTDLVLIHPGASHGIMGGHAIYGDLGATLIATEPPAWCRMLAGYVRDRGHSVAIIDAEAERLSPEEAAAKADGMEPTFIAIVVYGHMPSASSQQMVGASATAKALRRHRTHATVIMLGNHPSALPVRTLQEEAVDFVCDGEGAVTLDRLLAGDSVLTIPGLVWRDQHDAIRQNPRAPLVDLEKDLHGQTWDLLDLTKYVAHNWHCFDGQDRKPYASIITTLGCRFKCHFCMINVFQHANVYRKRTPKSVVDEMEMLYRDHGISNIKIIDEMFVLDYKHVNGICDEIISRGLDGKLNLWSYGRIDTVKSGILPKLKAAGFNWLALGIESGSKHVRDGADKHFSNDDIKKVVREIEAAGIHVISNFIFGLRDDTLESMQATLDMALDLNTAFANFYSCHAYPGSPLYDEAVEKGWTLPETFAGFSQHNEWTRPLDTEHISAKEVLAFRDAAFDTYFTHSRYLDMVEKKFGAETLAHVKDMTKYKLKRKLLTGEIT